MNRDAKGRTLGRAIYDNQAHGRGYTMNTQQLSTTVQERIDTAEAADAALGLAMSKFYDCTAKIEDQDGELFRELDAAWVDCIEAIRRIAWLDGWACGRNPEELIFAQEGGAL